MIFKPKCPTCKSKKTNLNIEIENYPLSIFPHKAEDAMNLQTARIEVHRCNNCGHYFSENHVNLDYVYEYAYKNYPHQYKSETFLYRNEFLKFFRNLGPINIKYLLEIGSNNFDDLSEFLEIADTVIGISLDATPRRSKNIELIRSSFDTFNFTSKFSIIVSRFVLEHIYDLEQHMAKVYEIIDDLGHFFVQIPNPNKMEFNNIFNVLAHEHFHYFTENSLRELFSQNGFEIVRLYDGNSFIIEAKKIKLDNHHFTDMVTNLNLKTCLFNVEKFKVIGGFLQSEINSGRSAILYGAGLNIIGLFVVCPKLRTNVSLQIVDDNHIVNGKYMPGSNIVISNLKDTKIDDSSVIIILANNIYQNQIIGKIKEMGLCNRVYDVELTQLVCD